MSNHGRNFRDLINLLDIYIFDTTITLTNTISKQYQNNKMKKNLQELSNEELLKEAKKTKFVFGIYLGIIPAMLIAGIFITVEKGVNFFTFFPVIFLGNATIFWSYYDKVKKELKSRDLK